MIPSSCVYKGQDRCIRKYCCLCMCDKPTGKKVRKSMYVYSTPQGLLLGLHTAYHQELRHLCRTGTTVETYLPLVNDL